MKLRFLSIVAFVSFLMVNCKNETDQKKSNPKKEVLEEEYFVERSEWLLDSTLTRGVLFNYAATFEYDYDDTTLYKPSIKNTKIKNNQDTLNIEIQFAESGCPAYIGGIYTSHDTLILVMQDKYPNESSTCEELYTVTYRICRKNIRYNHIKVERRRSEDYTETNYLK